VQRPLEGKIMSNAFYEHSVRNRRANTLMSLVRQAAFIGYA
jgi:hypothetical protein